MIESDDSSLTNKIILTSTNEQAVQINQKVLALLKGDTRIYVSADAIDSLDADEHLRFPLEFLNKQQPSGMPPHKLELKVGAIIMLLRNVDPRRGLLNGTRLQVKYLNDNYIIGEIIIGNGKGRTGVIPKIDMMSSDTLLPFVLKRRQFPVILSYGMTIHKAQGQSFDKIGVYLPEKVFAHGQLYVALSRVREGINLRIKLGATKGNKTKNIVFKELIDN